MSTLTKVADFADQFNERFGKILSVTPLILILLQFLIIVLAAGFNTGSIKLQESLQYINALMFLGGAGYTLKHNEHVRVDLFYSKFNKRQKAWVDFLGTLILMLPFVILLWYVGIPYVVESWVNHDASVEASGLPFVYILKTTVLLFSLTVTIQAISNLIRLSNTLFGEGE